MGRMRLSTLWAEGSLSYIERLSIVSALYVGHSVSMYTYGGIENAPYGVDIRDAREIMPDNLLLKHKKKNSYALAADLFRIFLLKSGNHCWIDCDLVFQKPLNDDQFVLGWENEKTLNNAVLKLPSDCAVLDDILALAFSNPIIAPYWRPQKKAMQWVRWGLGGSRKLEDLELGLTGPRMLTIFGKKHGLANKALPAEVFYPNSWHNAEDALNPNVNLRERTTDKTVAVHLWNGRIRKYKDSPPPPGSFIDSECKRLGIGLVAGQNRHGSRQV